MNRSIDRSLVHCLSQLEIQASHQTIMVAGMDNTDLAVLCALVLAVAAYLKRDIIKELLFSNDDSITANDSGSRDILQVMKDNNKNYLVLYASQTGTAEDYAKLYIRELVRLHGVSLSIISDRGTQFTSQF